MKHKWQLELNALHILFIQWQNYVRTNKYDTNILKYEQKPLSASNVYRTNDNIIQ